MPLSFSEQLESGMYDMYQLADLSNSWGMKVIEPYIHNTIFCFPKLPYHGKLLRMSNVYDTYDLNVNLGNSLNVTRDLVVSLGMVARQGIRTGFNVVIVQLLPYTLSRENCEHSNISKYAKKVRAHLECGACVREVSVVCVNTRERTDYRRLFRTHPILKKTLKQAQSLSRKVLVAIPVWNGIRPYWDRFYYWDPAFKRHRYINAHSTAHSREVRGVAHNFLQSLNLKGPILGIHVRLERLLRAKPFNKTLVTDCLTVKLQGLVRSLLANHSVQSAIMFRDYGKYGSSTCRRANCNHFAKEMGLDRTMESLGVRVLEYTPHGAKVRQEHGFSANVEQEVLSLSDQLVTVGYGSFQKSVVARFKRNRTRKRQQTRIFQICS
jgi:hypothetical protein